MGKFWNICRLLSCALQLCLTPKSKRLSTEPYTTPVETVRSIPKTILLCFLPLGRSMNQLCYSLWQPTGFYLFNLPIMREFFKKTLKKNKMDYIK